MRVRLIIIALVIFVVGPSVLAKEKVTITGELKAWHKVTLTFDGPKTSEDATPNPFLDYRLNVFFTKGDKCYIVPGYYAADGNAAQTSAISGNKWRVHFAPDCSGRWTYIVSFRVGPDIAISPVSGVGSPGSFDGLTGWIDIADTDKTGRDFRGNPSVQVAGPVHIRRRLCRLIDPQLLPGLPPALCSFHNGELAPHRGEIQRRCRRHDGASEALGPGKAPGHPCGSDRHIGNGRPDTDNAGKHAGNHEPAVHNDCTGQGVE